MSSDILSEAVLSVPEIASGVFTDTASRDIAVSVRGLAKSYSITKNAEKHSTLGESLAYKLKNPFAKVEKDTFWALNDVNFDIQKGDVVGIVGRNGAGKSTLLKVLSRITEPTKGRVDLYGRVGSLLEVGTGFHPELTGRENVYLNGAILGMKKSEIVRQFDAIVDFSGTEQFLDTPVKRYSSGMYVRLAFAVAAHLNPEILIVDEVLAVGDAEFQKKCLGKMQDVANAGRTVLLVSHNMGAIRQLCDSAVLLKAGRVEFAGDTAKCIDLYSSNGVDGESILSHLTKPHPDIVLDAILVNGSSLNKVNVTQDSRTLKIEFVGFLKVPMRIEMEALVTDLFDGKLGFFSPGHERAFVEVLPAGRFHLTREMELPERITKGEYLVHLMITEPDVQVFLSAPRAIRVFSEGTPTDTGRTLEYNGGAGWIHLSEPRNYSGAAG